MFCSLSQLKLKSSTMMINYSSYKHNTAKHKINKNQTIGGRDEAF